MLILSIFPGVDLLGRAFVEQGFCIVAGPDLLWGADIRDFHPPAGKFEGLIGGPQCKDFSLLNRNPGTYSSEMLDEYIRCVEESQPDWFLFENVPGAPEFTIEGFTTQRFPLDLAWFTPFSRLRYFIFGSKSGQLLNPMIGVKGEVQGTAVTGSDSRSFGAMCDIQGLPKGYDLPSFTLEAKKQAVANGVPLALGLYLARLIKNTLYGQDHGHTVQDFNRCACGCGAVVVGRAKTASVACRKRLSRKNC